MKESKNIWIFGLLITGALLIVPIVYFWPRSTKPVDDPWANVPPRLPHTDHTDLMEGPYETGSDVTKACLECHEDAALPSALSGSNHTSTTASHSTSQ